MLGVAQCRDHLLIVGDAVAVEHGDDDGTELRPWCRACRAWSAPPAAATRRWKIRSPAPARRESATPGRHSARRRRPSRSERGGLFRPWFRAAVRPRRPGRCNIRGRGRRRDRSNSSDAIASGFTSRRCLSSRSLMKCLASTSYDISRILSMYGSIARLDVSRSHFEFRDQRYSLRAEQSPGNLSECRRCDQIDQSEVDLRRRNPRPW